MREECEWSEWYDPNVRLFSVGMYIQADTRCSYCSKQCIDEGIVTRVEGNYYSLIPEPMQYCRNYIKKWRERIIKVGDDIEDAEVIEDQPKIPELT